MATRSRSVERSNRSKVIRKPYNAATLAAAIIAAGPLAGRH
jgi:hypothetical protein